jgi:hypothetical protein
MWLCLIIIDQPYIIILFSFLVSYSFVLISKTVRSVALTYTNRYSEQFYAFWVYFASISQQYEIDSYNDFHLVTSKQFIMLLYRVKIIYQTTANYYDLNYLTTCQVKALESKIIYYILYNIFIYVINNT